MKDSGAYRSSSIWNTVTSKHSDLANATSYKDLSLKLNSLDIFYKFSLNVTSASTCSFRFEEFVYTLHTKLLILSFGHLFLSLFLLMLSSN